MDKVGLATIFSGVLRVASQDKKIAGKTLAKKVGVSEQSMDGYMHGRSFPKVGTLVAICNELEITPNQLLGYEQLYKKEEKKGERKAWLKRQSHVAQRTLDNRLEVDPTRHSHISIFI